MTNNNYSYITDKELLVEVKNLNINIICLNRMLKTHHPELYTELLKRTDFLSPVAFSDGKVPI